MCGTTPPRGVWGYALTRKFRGRSGGFWGPKRLNYIQKMNFHDFFGGGGYMYVTTVHDRLASIML